MIDTVEESTQHNPLETNQRMILRLENSEQKSTLHHPIRKEILEVLCKGIEDYEVTIDSREEILENGTSIIHKVSTKVPCRRYWMSVSDILESMKESAPQTKLTKHQCYYHLQKLLELEMVEEFPPTSYDDGGNKQRSRDKHFRAMARIFLPGLRGSAPDLANMFLITLKDGWGVVTSSEDSNRLSEILFALDEILLENMKGLGKNLKDSPVGYLQLPFILEQLSWILLSEDEEFIRLLKEAQSILADSEGQLLSTEAKDTVHRQNDDIT